MDRHRACTIACSLVLLLSVCSARSAAADESAAPSVAKAFTAASITRGQSRFVVFADAILPDAAPSPRVVVASLFDQLSRPLPSVSVATTAIEPNPVAASKTTKIALAEPPGTARDDSIKPTIAERDSEPFGLETARAPQGALWIKWRKVQRAIQADAPALTDCRATASRCSPGMARFIAIVEQAARHRGRARLELVNQRINGAIRYASDERQWHRADVWSTPFDKHHTGSFQTGKGDCEDYAIAKYVALRNAGTPAQDLRLLVVRDNSVRSYHAVLAARQNGQWYLLDNRWRRLIPDNEAQFFTPLFALNAAGVQRFAAARANNRQAAVKRAAKAPGRTTLAGELGATPNSA